MFICFVRFFCFKKISKDLFSPPTWALKANILQPGVHMRPGIHGILLSENYLIRTPWQAVYHINLDRKFLKIVRNFINIEPGMAWNFVLRGLCTLNVFCVHCPKPCVYVPLVWVPPWTCFVSAQSFGYAPLVWIPPWTCVVSAPCQSFVYAPLVWIPPWTCVVSAQSFVYVPLVWVWTCFISAKICVYMPPVFVSRCSGLPGWLHEHCPGADGGVR